MLSSLNMKPLKMISVLYVEDDFETREELQILLSEIVGELHVAANGYDGLRLYQEHQPDIVITDIQMPDMNGLSMAADIRHNFPDQEIIILSAYNDTEYLFRVLEMGIRDYITKPISIERLIEKLICITKRINQSKELQQQRKFLEQNNVLLDETALVGRVNQQGIVTYVNQHFCALSGFSAEEAIGHDYKSFCATESLPVLLQLKRQLSKTGTWNGKVINKTKSGGRYIVEGTVMKFKVAADQPEEYLVLMLDISELYEKYQRLVLNQEKDLK
jgi:PAS domain S-box-containing protein